ncbi:MAG: NAD-dependent epimerase/dehydratase family protein [Phycisphaerales bacterium]|nr:NAD-dependent epimerase/dehydratase family protein [Phycisphaerales bacterium]
MKRYLVTGGAGFIGSNLGAEIIRRGDGVVIVDDFRTGSWENIVEACHRRGVEFRGRVLPFDYRRVDLGTIGSVDGIFHLAAITDTLVDDDQLVLDLNAHSAGILMAECARGGIPMVYASSAAVYGLRERSEKLCVGDSLRPLNLYGFSKLALEALHAEFGSEKQIVGLRYFNVFGHGEAHKGRMASMVRQLATGARSGTVELFSPGDQARDWIAVDAVVSATLMALETEPGTYNVGSGHAVSFRDVVDLVSDGRATKIAWKPIPNEIARRYQAFTLAGPPFVPRWTAPGKATEQAIREYARELMRI